MLPVSRVGFVGVGTMGSLMARRLLDAGYEVIACDTDPGRIEALEVARATTPAELATEADVLITSLPSPEIVEAVVAGHEGIRDGARPGTTVIEMSTSPPALERQLAAALAESSIEFLDAPVSGGPIGARAGTLAIMVGGKREIFELHRPLLENLGALVVHAGDVGSGQVLKLCNNLIVAAEMVAICEGSAILEREGLDPKLAFEVLTSSTSDSRVMRVRFPLADASEDHPSSRSFEPMFTLDLLHKDLELGLELATEAGVKASVAMEALRAYSRARAAGLGGLDYSAVYRAIVE